MIYFLTLLFTVLCLPTSVLGLSQSKYTELVRNVKRVIDNNPLRDRGDENDGDTLGALVRLVFHDAGTYTPGVAQSGAHGCILYDCGEGNECARRDPENNGMQRASDLVLSLYEQYGLTNDDLSRADFLYLVGNAAVELSADEDNFSIGFRTGRTDCEGFQSFPGALPEASGRAEIRRVFGRLGFSDAEAVTLLGAHTLGRCELRNSGFEFPWVNHPDKFDARYFKWMIGKDWKQEVNAAGNEQWYNDEFMMLNADVDLAFTITDDCKDDLSSCAKGPQYNLVEKYADDDEYFLEEFKHAYQKLAEKTDDNLVALEQSTSGRASGSWRYGAIGGSVAVFAGLLAYTRSRVQKSVSPEEEEEEDPEQEMETEQVTDQMPALLLSEADFISSEA